MTVKVKDARKEHFDWKYKVDTDLGLVMCKERMQLFGKMQPKEKQQQLQMIVTPEEPLFLRSKEFIQDAVEIGGRKDI